MEIPTISLEGDTIKKLLITAATVFILEGVQYFFYKMRQGQWDKQETVYQEKLSALDKEKVALKDSLLLSESKMTALRVTLHEIDSVKTSQINKLETLLQKHEKSITTLSNANSDELGSFFSTYQFNTGN
jgi:predicted  nucleic acid-binding Zn-ribbon protein